MPSRSRRIGFTLVEVLVATVLLALGLLGGLAAFSMATRASAASTNDTVIPLLAQAKLAEVQAVPRDELATGTTQGDFGDAYPGCRWELTIHPPDELHVVRVDLTIQARQSGRQRETTFSTAIF